MMLNCYTNFTIIQGILQLQNHIFRLVFPYFYWIYFGTFVACTFCTNISYDLSPTSTSSRNKVRERQREREWMGKEGWECLSTCTRHLNSFVALFVLRQSVEVYANPPPPSSWYPDLLLPVPPQLVPLFGPVPHVSLDCVSAALHLAASRCVADCNFSSSFFFPFSNAFSLTAYPLVNGICALLLRPHLGKNGETSMEYELQCELVRTTNYLLYYQYSRRIYNFSG